jgi:hypothetical protein
METVESQQLKPWAPEQPRLFLYWWNGFGDPPSALDCQGFSEQKGAPLFRRPIVATPGSWSSAVASVESKRVHFTQKR